MKTTFFWMMLLMIAMGSTKSFALTPDEIRSSIHYEMSQRHPQPSAQFWTNLGPDALPVIEQMFSETTSPLERSWLIDGMSYFNDPSVATLLENEIANSSNALMNKKMLGALIQSQGDDAFGFVEPFLDNKDPHIRLQVATSMKRYMENAQAKTRVDQLIKTEKLAWVRDEVKKDPAKETTLKREGSIYQHQEDAKPQPTPLPEKSWAGEWKGVYLTAGKTEKRNGPANLILTLMNDKAGPSEQKWKLELKLPKQTKIELKGKEIEIVYYQTAQAHWLEVRDKKNNAVFVGQRP